jgi:DNA-binding transcriptional MerR regulator
MAKAQKRKARATALDIKNVVAAFSEEQVEKITGLTKGRLRYWAKTDFFHPSFTDENQRLPYSRFYSFKDIVALRTLEMLRVQNGVPLQHLRKVAEKLSDLKDDLWTKTILYAVNRKVVFMKDDAPVEVVSGQYLLGIPLKKVIEDTNADIVEITHRPKNTYGKVSRNRSIVRNAWVVSGTRIPIGAIKRLHEDGYSVAEIINEYPDLSRSDVEVALRHEGKKAA